MRLLQLTAVAVLLAATIAGCRGRTSEDAPVVVLRNMYNQPRYNPQAESTFYADKRTMRPPPEGTYAREMEINPVFGTGRTGDDMGFVEAVPPAIVQRAGGMAKMLERGEERYGIYCVPCHDGLGTGKGMVIQKAKVATFNPPTLHSEKVRQMADGQLFQIISYGNNQMPAYAAQVPVDDRWAIVSYVRALQLSQAK